VESEVGLGENFMRIVMTIKHKSNQPGNDYGGCYMYAVAGTMIGIMAQKYFCEGDVIHVCFNAAFAFRLFLVSCSTFL